MTAVLIDLRVRPIWSTPELPDCDLVAVQARARGLDGVALLSQDRPLALGDLSVLTAATGVQFFAGVELSTTAGTLLCFPRQLGGWFAEAGWQSLAQGEPGTAGRYPAEAVVQAFVERGGAVVGLPEAEGYRPPAGVSGLLVLGGEAIRLDEEAVRTAQTGRLACLGGTGASPEDAWFGSTATVFASPPADQEGLIDGIRSGRAWPAEIGWTVPIQAAVAKQPTSEAAEAGVPARSAPPAEPRPERKPRERQREIKEAPAATEAVAPRGRTKKQPGRYDVPERPGDNRGNRLNRDELLRALYMPPTADENQPANDPIALFYGVETRRQNRYRDRADTELDRLLNGNRAKGPDPNVMAMPNFEETRGDRQPIHVLFAPSEEQHDLEDSIALRFALSHVRRNEDGTLILQGNPLDRGRMPQRGRQQRRRR